MSYEYPDPGEVEAAIAEERERLEELLGRQSRLRELRKGKLSELEEPDYAELRELQMDLDMVAREVEWQEVRVEGLGDLLAACELEADRTEREHAWREEVEDALIDFGAALEGDRPDLEAALEAHDRLTRLDGRMDRPIGDRPDVEIPDPEERRERIADVAGVAP